MGPGALAAIGNLFANQVSTRWERPRGTRFLPTKQEVVLVPSTDDRWRCHFQSKKHWNWGINYSQPYRAVWSRDGTKLLAIVSIGWHEVIIRNEPLDPRFSTASAISSFNTSDRLVEAWDIPSGNR
jgi:hypothetical protein